MPNEPVSQILDLISECREKYKDDQSMLMDIESNLHKCMLVAAGSWMEFRVCGMLEDLFRARSNAAWCPQFVRRRALERKYHSLFNWEVNNCNSFWSSFGEPIASIAKELQKTDNLAALERCFLNLGNYRNLVAHDYSGFNPNTTPEESYALFQSSEEFIDRIKAILEMTTPEEMPTD